MKNATISRSKLVQNFPRTSSCRGHLRGSILLEIMLAVAIIGFALTGFALVLQQTMMASKEMSHVFRLRLALQSRMEELKAEKLESGEKDFQYKEQAIVLKQRIAPADLRNQDGEMLSGLWRIYLKASPEKSEILPMEVEIVMYQP